MAQCINLIPDFLHFWEEAEYRSPAEQQTLWYDRYETLHHELIALTGGRHGNAEHLPFALRQFPTIVPDLPNVAARVQTTISNITPDLCTLFDLPHLDLQWVLLVGMFWADGWVVDVDGIPTCFIAVEHLVHASPARARLLLGHEAAHVAHAACLGPAWDALETIGHHLFLEGLATVASAHLVPGLDPAAYAWLGLKHTIRGLNLDEWRMQCERAWPHERDEMLPHLVRDDPATFARFFLQAPPDVPERFGYFVGWQFVAELLRHHHVAELARWSPPQIHEHLLRSVVLR